ncbi:hypothetical protein FF38_11251 [Lucilia cuprina]|uniref:Uncharacterized protein n=1 Tax=Lucilia cuprina TaxID=7375 RepID=A0A0L0BL98_LUCCU|nr:hypothetical protein FF38_11251 [Lucilia cuprina]
MTSITIEEGLEFFALPLVLDVAFVAFVELVFVAESFAGFFILFLSVVAVCFVFLTAVCGLTTGSHLCLSDGTTVSIPLLVAADVATLDEENDGDGDIFVLYFFLVSVPLVPFCKGFLSSSVTLDLRKRVLRRVKVAVGISSVLSDVLRFEFELAALIRPDIEDLVPLVDLRMDEEAVATLSVSSESLRLYIRL